MNSSELQETTADDLNVPEIGGTTTGHEHPGGNRILIAGIVAIAVLFALVATVLHHESSATFIGFQWWKLVLVAGILGLSGLISGLAGFGFSAIGSPCLLLIPPTLAVPLLMALSAANQFLSIGQLRADMPKTWKEVWPNGYGPYVLGGILGVPFGIWVLNHLSAAKLMLAFGVILAAYSVYSLLKPSSLKMKGSGGVGSGVTVGLIGGVVGGFTAFPGVAVVVWTGLRDIPKRLTRSIVQPYIIVLQLVSLATNAYAHPSTFGRRFWILLAIILPVVLPSTVAGVALYRRVSDVNFKRISFILLGLSGVGLLVKVLLK
jgi:uncharacterized membrane protein YfcA